MMQGFGGPSGYKPCRARMSAKFKPAAFTRTRTCPSAGFGSGRSSTFIADIAISCGYDCSHLIKMTLAFKSYAWLRMGKLKSIAKRFRKVSPGLPRAAAILGKLASLILDPEGFQTLSLASGDR